jgi:hypothetical protein
LIAFAPVLLTFKVGLEAVLVLVNLTATTAPVTRENPVQAATLAAVEEEVEQVA